MTKVQQEYNDMGLAFSLTLLSDIYRSTDGASFNYSPLSLQYLLGILSNMVNDDDKEAIINTVYGKDVSVTDINGYLNVLMTKLPALDLSTDISVTNMMLLSDVYGFETDRVSVVETAYNALVAEVDFTDKYLCLDVNNWSSVHTNGLIPYMVKEFDSATAAYLANSLYFKASWTFPFDKGNTVDDVFTSIDNNTLMVRMMSLVNEFEYYENDMFKMINLPYGNEKLMMSVILPNETTSFELVLEALGDSHWRQFQEQMQTLIIDLKFPEFSFESSVDFKQILRAFGRDFIDTEIVVNSGENVPLTEMNQMTRISVNEAGTCAASVTDGIAGVDWGNPDNTQEDIVDFHADQPFIYMISDRVSGVILFAGIYTGKSL